MEKLIYFLPFIILIISCLIYLYLKNKTKKSFVVVGGCTIGIITLIMVISALCSIIQFIWFLIKNLF